MSRLPGFVATLFSAAGALGLALPGSPAMAQADLCAQSAIELVVPWAAGGGTDVHARLIAQPLSERLGKQVVVVNRPGAGGVVGTTSFVHNAKPDGCSLLMATGATNTAAPHIFKDLKFKPLEDFSPIAFVASAPNLLYVRAKSSYQSVQEVIDKARAAPGSMTYSSGGVGASSHLAGALFAEKAGLQLVHVPYQGGGPSMAALIGGQVDISLDTAAQIGHIRSGNLRALAVAAEKRLTALPDIPTFDEAGLPGLYYSFWSGIAGPKGMPPAMVERLNREINAVLALPGIQQQFFNSGSELKVGMTPAQFTEFWQSEYERNAHIVRIANARAD